METIEVAEFADIAEEFAARTTRMVWCNVATIDAQGRPRSRILHPIWEGNVGWITTDPRTLKARHLARVPYVSLAYVAAPEKPAYADCLAQWVDDLAQKQRTWDLVAATPAPLGFDPAPIYGSPDGPRFGLLKLTPWRIEVSTPPEGRRVWHAPQ
jgi:pyridoxamine 5'-phosphate oxidase-like protein